jgi:tumor protein p53-inducible protein 3
MKGVVVSAPGEPDVLQYTDVEKPIPKENEVLVRVYATGVNRADTLQRKGQYAPPPGSSSVLGLEAVGEVVSDAY